MSLSEQVTEEARLIILRELLSEPNRSMTSTSMCRALLDKFLIERSREWVERQYRYLEEHDAVRVTPAGSVKIATLAPRGVQHLAMKIFIDGVLSPSEPVL